MPLVDSNQAALWDGGPSSLYRDGSGRGYVRAAMADYYGLDVEKLIAALEGKGLTKAHRVVLIGAGFGYAHERFLAAGYGPTADGTAAGKLLSVDTSTWIQNNKSGHAAVPVLNADVNAATGRRILRQQFGSATAAVDWVISEDVLPLLIGTDPQQNNEIIPFCQNLRSLAANVAHWVSVATASGDPRLNWKTLEQWKQWVAPDYVIQRGTETVL